MLTISTFAVQVKDGTNTLALTVKGPECALPEGTRVEKGKKGVRTIFADVIPDQYANLMAIGEKIDLKGNGAVHVGDDDKQYWEWFGNFVPKAQGGTKDEEPEAPAAAAAADPEPEPEKPKKSRKAKAEKPELDDAAARLAAAKSKKAPEPPEPEPAPKAPPKAAKAAAAEPKPKKPRKGETVGTPEPPKEDAAITNAKTALHADADVRAAFKAALPVLGGRRLRLLTSAIIAELEGSTPGLVFQPHGRRLPLHHVPGRIFSTVKRHHNEEWGTMHYSVRCEEDGGYTVVDVEGPRTDVTKKMRFKDANALLRLLTGRDVPRVQVYRYFETWKDPK